MGNGLQAVLPVKYNVYSVLHVKKECKMFYVML